MGREPSETVQTTDRESTEVEKDKFIELELASKGIVIVRKMPVQTLIYTPAVKENMETPTNPYPTRATKESWVVNFGYDKTYSVSKAQFKKLKDSLEITPLQESTD